MNMISTLRRKFTSGNSVPVERVSITVEGRMLRVVRLKMVREMENIIENLMANTGVVRQELEYTGFGKTHPSRGYYITTPCNGVWYLHHDGKVKEGVRGDSEEPAFWPTEEEAQTFFDNWKNARA